MEELKQYTFIKPDTLTIEQKYNIYLTYKDVGNYPEITKESFYAKYKNADHFSSLLTHYMIKYKSTLADFNVSDHLPGKIINGILVNNNIQYKKRVYRVVRSLYLNTGDNVLFIKSMYAWGYFIQCDDIEENGEEKSTLKHKQH